MMSECSGNNIEGGGHKRVFMVGAFPPPMHGMAAVNDAVSRQLLATETSLTIFDISARSLNRSLMARFMRFPAVLYSLSRMIFDSRLKDAILYMSVSGGLGQVYEMLFLILARLHGMRIYLHHHSFAYLEKRRLVTQAMILLAGRSSTHITLSTIMAERLKLFYTSVGRIVPISNSVFFSSGASLVDFNRHSLKTIGFISNISAEKGIFDFLDLVKAYEACGLPLNAKIAGPFQDYETEQKVRRKFEELGTVDYLGPQYGDDKELFYTKIDVLVFPTRYANEAEPLTIHEAMQHGVPVIAFGRGSIPEIVDSDCGLVVEIGQSFTTIALKHIKQWIDHPEFYRSSSREAIKHFNESHEKNIRTWKTLLEEILGRSRIGKPEFKSSSEDAS